MALCVPRPGHRTEPLTVELFSNKSWAIDLCSSFLDDALATVEEVVKKGLKEHHSLETLLSSYQPCISNLLIVSDTRDIVQGQHAHNILGNLPIPTMFDFDIKFGWRPLCLYTAAQFHQDHRIRTSIQCMTDRVHGSLSTSRPRTHKRPIGEVHSALGMVLPEISTECATLTGLGTMCSQPDCANMIGPCPGHSQGLQWLTACRVTDRCYVNTFCRLKPISHSRYRKTMQQYDLLILQFR
jgi:hypothetical protein